MRPPLLVHVVFHPTSDGARETARRIHTALNADLVVPGLRVPTTFAAHDDGRPPASGLDLDQAEHSFVVLLADLALYVDETGWCDFAGDIWEQCAGSDHRMLPFQMHGDAYPVDDRMRGASFPRAYAEPEETRDDFVVRRTIVELCRYLHGDEPGDDDADGADVVGAPTKVFLSHTKMDIGREPRAAERLREHLSTDQPIKTWFDTGDIAGGSEFAKRIAAGIEDSSLLCVLTDNYASREWCRREVLLGKRAQRPIVVVDALTGQEVRSFPYLGNLPVMRWCDDPQPAIDLVLKETLRHLHTERLLEVVKRDGDVLFTRPPELVTLAQQEPGTTVLYPDPPLGVEETETMERSGVHVVTPLQRVSAERDLSGVRIALSMSESTDIDRHGFEEVHLTSAMLEISRHLLIRGATLVYGGHLETGYTELLAEVVRTHNALPGVEPVERLENFVGWPIPFNDELRAKYKAVAKLVRVPRPDDVTEELDPDFVAEPEYFPATQSAVHRFAWARGMTEMRSAQADTVAARIVLGGTVGPTTKEQANGVREVSWYASRIPGVLEEVITSVRAGHPVFLLGAFGGVPALVMDVLDGVERDDMTWEFHQQAPGAPGMRELYEAQGPAWEDYPAMVEFLRERGLAGINPLLDEDAHRALFRARHPAEIVELLLDGLSRLG